MMFWETLWKICLIGSVGTFMVMAIVVTIGGASDIKHLLQRLKDDQDD